jgi:pimeloyl-ACP methyl ester carboxylesterase
LPENRCNMKPAPQSYSLIQDSYGEERVKFGTLAVPEDHENPGGKTIEIAWAVISAKDATKQKHPLIFLTGGPGGETLPIVPFIMDLPLAEDRDLILFDQRGIGLSSALPDFGEGLLEILAADLTPEQEKDEFNRLLQLYRKKAQEKGIHLHHYNTFQNARDVGMLMEHLGYGRYHVMGGSYGSRLARVIMDKFPEFIETAVLDSPNPFENDFITSRIKSYAQSLQLIFDQCKVDISCNIEYPNLEKEYFEGIEILFDDPLKIELDDFTFYVNPQDAIYILRYQLYRGDALNGAPALIRAFNSRNKDHVRQNLETALPMIADGNYSMFLSAERFEHYDSSINREILDQLYREMELFPAPIALFTSLYLAAGSWHHHSVDPSKKIFNQSDIPTLIFVNKYDPVTPPENGRIMKGHLNRGYLFILDEGGHGEGNLECKIEVIRIFFDHPNSAPDPGCLNIADS